jgi:hypothetical protein
MTSKSYTHRWCVVKGVTVMKACASREAAEDWARRISDGEQADVYELVGNDWVWRCCFLTILAKPEAA